MTDAAAETECVEEFLQRAKFWRSIAVWLPFRDSVPGSCEEELKDSARRTIYWAMKNARYDMTRPDFSTQSRWDVLLILTEAILPVNNNSPERKVVSRNEWTAQVERNAARVYAKLAIIAADLTYRGDWGPTALYTVWDSSAHPDAYETAWRKVPLQLRLQDCVAAIQRGPGRSLDPAAVAMLESLTTDSKEEFALQQRISAEWAAAQTQGRDGCADDPMGPKPTLVPSSAVTSSDDDDCCTFEELEAALTQLAPEKADGNSPVTINETRPTASAFVATHASVSAASQGQTTPPTAASPAPFCFTGDKLASAEVRVKAAAPTTAFPFSAPVVGYKGLTAVDVQRSEPAKPCCTRTYRLRKSRAQFLQGLPTALRLRYITAYHRRRMRVLQGREQSQNRALLESAKAGCGDTHVRQNKSVFFFSAQIRA